MFLSSSDPPSVRVRPCGQPVRALAWSRAAWGQTRMDELPNSMSGDDDGCYSHHYQYYNGDDNWDNDER